jgi:hypothetical protein
MAGTSFFSASRFAASRPHLVDILPNSDRIPKRNRTVGPADG